MFERASAMRFDVAAALAAALLWPATVAVASEPYVVAEALFLQRDNESTPRTLVMNSDTNQPAIGTADLRFPVAGGVRLFVGRHGEDRHGWEIGYLGVYGMVADAAVAGSGNLEIAPDLANQVASLRGAALAGCSYGSAINGCEANLLATSDYVHHARDNAYRADGIPHTATVDWIAGFRWAGLEENASIGLATPGLGVSGYGVRATSNLFGGQLGVRGRIDWERWGLEGWAKAAVAGAALSQSQTPIVDAVIDRQYRSERGARAGDVGGIFDWSVTAVRHINDTWSIRAGYTMIWLTGVALAPDQFDFTVDTTAGTSVVGEKTVWLQGGSLGLEARW